MENFLSDNQTVGTILKQEREKRHKTIEDIEQVTHIRSIFLKYIEEDNFEALPSSLHITGFLKVYSQYLGLDEHFIMNAYKKQILLVQELPSEEIFSISKNSTKKSQYKIIISICLVIFLLILIYFLFFFHISPKNKSAILNTQTPSQIFTLSKGEEFSFIIKDQEIMYKILDTTDSSITLSNITTQTSIPPFLFTEILEYDLEGNDYYDYMIKVLNTENNHITLEVSLINILKNPGQLSYAIVKSSGQEKDINQNGVLSIQNTSLNKLLILQLDLHNNTSSIELNPMQTKQILYFNKELKPQFKSIYIQDISHVNLKIDNNIIMNENITIGSLGLLSCENKDNIPICTVNTGMY